MSLSGFVKQAIREKILRRQQHSEFVARGLASRDDAKRSGDYMSAEEMLSRLSKRLATVRHQLEDDYH